ncbi:Pentatricopeptide repeat-containing protein [Forsythia ovata]|uniref:Pentatricopeptide repeat-containing protein n=1 Tax=Forsythia ovata TaxID=205694 RepID=A0ABD1T458_9LAMI
MSLPAFTANPTTPQQLLPPLPQHFLSSRTNTSPPNSHNRKSSHSNEINITLEPTTASWTSSIAHHCKNGHLSKATSEFTRMRLCGVEPNYITFVTLFSGCAHFPSQQARNLGPSLHGYARKLGMDAHNVMVGTAVVGMYSKFGELGLARLSFDHMGAKNKVSWNTMIDGYMRSGKFEEAIKLFDEMPERDKVSWTALIGGFVKRGRFEEALEWFQEMLLSGLEPDYVTMVSVLSATANLGTLGLGLWLHRFVLIQDFKDNTRVNNSLIDMYCRCGCVELACQVFKNMPKRNLVSWNSILVGLATNGNAKEALEYFDLMQKDVLEPDGVSFTAALTACSHAGLVNEGLELFDAMKKVFKITPSIEHYGCIVDLYSRAGRLPDALQVIEKMPMRPNAVVVGSLLAACRTRGDINLAERLMNYVYDLDPSGDSNYVLLSNIYAALGSWRGASNMRMKMKELGIQKRPGISSIEVDGVVHEFMAGDLSHVDAEHIYETLEQLSLELRISGYAPELDLRESYDFDS